MRSVFVTGANGFVGRAVCAHLSGLGHDVTGGVRDLRHTEGVACARLRETGPLEEENAPLGALEGFDTVVHCAGWNGAVPKGLSRDGLASADTAGAFRLCRSAAASGVGHFVLLSSIKACASLTHGTALNEQSPALPDEPYGVAKLNVERKIGEVAGIAKTIIRPPAIYGPGMRGGMLRLFQLASWRVPLPTRSLANSRDFLSLPSLANLVGRCVDQSPQVRPPQVGSPEVAEGVRIVLGCDGEPISTPDLYDRIAGALGRRALQFPLPSAIARVLTSTRQPAIQSLFSSLRIDDHQSRQVLGWAPSVRMDDVIAETARRFVRRG